MKIRHLNFLVLAISSTAISQPIWTDTEFTSPYWNSTVMRSGALCNSAFLPMSSGGNFGRYARVVTNVYGPGTEWVYNFLTRSDWVERFNDHSLQSIDFGSDTRMNVGFGDGQGHALIVIQSGTVYVAGYTTTPNFYWTHYQYNNLHASDFFRLNPNNTYSAVRPRFGAGSPPATFGFMRCNGGWNYGIDHSIDNLTIRRRWGTDNGGGGRDSQ